MTIRISRLSSRAALLGLLLTVLAACAAPDRPTVVQADAGAPAGEDAAPVQPPAPEPPRPAAVPSSTTSELQGLIQARQVTELRTTYNGTYGASLLFKADTLTYYVTLFQQKNFWKVVKTTSETRAEQLYASYVAQTEELAEVDIRRIKLQAEYSHTEKQLSDRATQLNTLQADLTAQRQQAQEVAVRQQQARQEASQLAQQQQDAREQLRSLQRQIEALERQKAALGGGSGRK